MSRWLSLTLVASVAILLGWLLLHPRTSVAPQPVRPPPLSVTTLDGKKLSLPVTQQGGIVNIFASWCVPCAAEMPLLEILSQDNHVKIYGIAYKDNRIDLADFLKRFGNPFAKIALDDGTAATALAITGVPESFLIAPDGTLRAHMEGALDDGTVKDWQREIATWQK